MPNPHTLHLGLTAEVVTGQNHSEWVHIKAALLRCTVRRIPSSSATEPFSRRHGEEGENQSCLLYGCCCTWEGSLYQVCMYTQSSCYTFCVHTHTNTHSQTDPQGLWCLASPTHSHQSVIMKFSFISAPSPMPCLTTCRKVQIVTHTHKYNRSQSCHCLSPCGFGRHPCRAQD